MRTPTPAMHSPPEKRALLRRTWQPPFDSLEVDYSRADLRIELVAADRALFSGIWTWQGAAAERPLTAAGTWEEVCWHSDKDVDYLELELPLSSGWKLQRQMLLARNDQFLYLADALLGEKPLGPNERPEIRYESHLPLAKGIVFEPAAESRDGVLLLKKKRVCRLLPLAVPEWRIERSAGELERLALPEQDGLRLTQAAQGRNLYAPLWLDLAGERLRRPFTWRRLTVGENLQIQPRDIAAGYRVQVGKEQWLLYRSLGAKGNRTLLGQNYSTEFVACRFLPSGETEDLVEIE